MTGSDEEFWHASHLGGRGMTLVAACNSNDDPPLSLSNIMINRVTPGIDQIPQELLDHIIDLLHDDKSALANCTLVLRQWIHRARYHLFSKTVFPVTRTPLTTFLEFLSNDAPLSVTTNIRSLTLNSLVRQVTLSHLASVLAELPHLRHLRLDKVKWGRHPDGTLIGGLPKRCSFSVLSLTHTILYDRDLEEVLLLCPPHAHLFLEEALWIHPQPLRHSLPAETHHALSQIQLGKLSMGKPDATQFDVILDVVHATSSVRLGTLTHLELNYLHKRDIAHVNRVLAELGPNLRDLTLDLVSFDKAVGWIIDEDETSLAAIKFELRPCASLQSLQLDFADPWNLGWLVPPMLAELFAQRTAPAPLTLRLGIAPHLTPRAERGVHDADEHTDAALARVAAWDAALAAHPRAQLGRVEIRLTPEARHHVFDDALRDGRVPDAAEQAAIRACMPALCRAGVLAFAPADERPEN